jgi:ABC-2 type transport system ATP-binding protein
LDTDLPILRLDQLTERFGSYAAVDRLSFSVAPGESFGLLGPNGAGKTTTIKILTTLLPPTSGRAEVAGFDVERQADQVRRVIGYVPQLISADPQATAYENLWLFACLYDVPRSERSDRIEEALEFMGLRGSSDVLVRRFSGGMIRRLEIAQSMLHRPRMLFLDEPTIGLDPTARTAVWNHIRRLRREFGMTILFTTHYMDEAAEEAERLAILHRGALVALGAPQELTDSLGRPGATLSDVFNRFSGSELETAGGEYRAVVSERRSERKLG